MDEFKVMRFNVGQEDKDEFDVHIGTDDHWDAIRITRWGAFTQPAEHVRPKVTWFSSSSSGDLTYAGRFAHALHKAVNAANMIDYGAEPLVALKGAGFEFASDEREEK